MTSDSQPQQLPQNQADSLEHSAIGAAGFQAVRIDGQEELTGPLGQLREKYPGRPKVLATKLHVSQEINQRVDKIEPSQVQSGRISADFNQLTYQVPSLQKLKYLNELNQFLDDLSVRVHDLEVRENFVSHSLLMLDHERRQFRLWKSIELQELEHQKREWTLSNYGIPQPEVWSELSVQDLEIIEALKAVPEAPVLPEPESVTVIKEVEPVTPAIPELEVPKPTITQERIYILDVTEEDVDLPQKLATPSVVLPDETMQPIRALDEPLNLAVHEDSSERIHPAFKLDDIEIEFTAETIHEDVPTTSNVVEQDTVSSLPEVQVEQAALAQAAVAQYQAFEANLLQQQQEWETLREQQLEDLERRQKLSLKQIRFQKEHLEKIRREFEHERNESLFELQQLQTGVAHSIQILNMQQQQYRQARQLLDERSESIIREETILRELMKLTNEQHAQAEVEAEYIFSLEARLKSAMEIQVAEFKRQETQLLHYVQLFTPKQKQLLQMQREMEQSHRETIIIREALQRAWLQIKGDEQFPQLEEAYHSHKNSLELSLSSNLEELINKLNTIGTEQHASLNQIEHGLRTSLEVLETIRQELLQLIPPVSELKSSDYEMMMAERQQWLEEKLEAERIIRQLVDQLELRMSIQDDQLDQEPTSQAA